jgi:hypothetical protein
MRKLISILTIVFITTFAVGQSGAFISKAKSTLEATDSIESIETIKCSTDEYDFIVQGMTSLESIFMSEMKRVSHNKPDELQVSQTLGALAEIATESWKGSQYANHKKWKKINKYFKRAANQCTSRFNIIRSISFRIPLVNNHGKKFYYDRKGAKGELNLFYGSPPKTKLEREKSEQEPLGFFTEEELIEKSLRKMRKRGVFADVKRGYYSYVGVKIEVDEKSLFKNRIPTARVVVVLGARRMRVVRPK